MSGKAAPKKTVTQEELRRMMKEKSATKKVQITSEHAKYNSLDQLMCTLCNTVVKNERLWNAHILSRTHKENLVKPAPSQPLRPPPLSRPSQKRPTEDVSVLLLDSKKLKSENQPGEKKTVRFTEYESSGNGSDDEVAANKEPESVGKSATHIEEVQDVPKFLPEGFFDDPKLDAKARNVPFKEKIDEELEKFQKEIQDETDISEAIMGEDDVERDEQNDIYEIDEQIQLWKRVYDLTQRQRPVTCTGERNKEKEDNDDEEEENGDSDNFNSWKDKGAWR